MKYRKKPVVIEAKQWDRLGDHTSVSPWGSADADWINRHRDCCIVNRCQSCQQPLDEHGLVQTLEGYHIVCPGDWIITGIKGETYPCKPDIFEVAYEPAE